MRRFLILRAALGLAQPIVIPNSKGCLKLTGFLSGYNNSYPPKGYHVTRLRCTSWISGVLISPLFFHFDALPIIAPEATAVAVLGLRSVSVSLSWLGIKLS